MKIPTVVLALATTSGVLSSVFKRDCNANNCLREIRGTDINLQSPLTSRIADCSAFMLATVTPATTTTTITAPYFPPTAKARSIQVRQVTVIPSSQPAYASFCTGISAYSSACSCMGITATTFTAPTPTVTATVTAANPCRGTYCFGMCVDLSSDNNNCGRCGNVCDSVSVCIRIPVGGASECSSSWSR